MDHHALVFRTARASDADAIVALVESAYRGESGLRGWTTETHLLDGRRTNVDDVRTMIATPSCRLLLAESDCRLLASCLVERRDEGGYFGMFAVDPDAQGAGIGKQVLARAERLAAESWGCKVMRMTVIVQRDELIAWYGRRGYRRTGQFEPFPYGDERFGIPRRDDLRFEVLFKNLVETVA